MDLGRCGRGQSERRVRRRGDRGHPSSDNFVGVAPLERGEYAEVRWRRECIPAIEGIVQSLRGDVKSHAESHAETHEDTKDCPSCPHLDADQLLPRQRLSIVDEGLEDRQECEQARNLSLRCARLFQRPIERIERVHHLSPRDGRDCSTDDDGEDERDGDAEHDRVHRARSPATADGECRLLGCVGEDLARVGGEGESRYGSCVDRSPCLRE